MSFIAETISLTPFEAHFNRSPNTPLEHISTSASIFNFTCKKIINHYLVEHTMACLRYRDSEDKQSQFIVYL